MILKKRSAGHSIIRICALSILAFCTFSQAHAQSQLSATATASTNFQAASLAVDGNQVSRWESSHGVTPSWLTLDLGEPFALSQVSIDWEAANAANYLIEGSNDNTQWATLESFSGGTFGDRTDSLNISGSYRYVRMYATARSAGNYWGYSIFEMVVNGNPVTPVADSDNDGVNDNLDQCPNTSAGAVVDLVGCPSTLIDNGSTTIDTSSGLEWLDLTSTQGISAQEVLAGYDGYIAAGWSFATVEQVCGLFGTLGDDTTGCTTGVVNVQMDPTNAETFVNLLGNTAAVGRGAYGMFNNISDFPNSFGIGCINDTATTCTFGGASTWLTKISWGSGYLTVGSFLVKTTVFDADGDGVPDASDQCPNTSAGASVDAFGCELPAEFSGATLIDTDSAEFFVNSGSWADIHYKINNGLQQNVRMTQSGGRNTISLNGLVDSDVVDYNFTYWDPAINAQIDTLWQQYDHLSSAVGDADNDGVDDNIDQCANTPAGATINSVGCPSDSDGDSVLDGLDQCANTPMGAVVDANGCPLDSDNDSIFDGIDQCPGTTVGAIVDNVGCEVISSKLSATASATSAFQAASLAVDGNQTTRWESNHLVDPSILTLDLGSTFELTDVIIYWEAANADTYTVQGSNDNSQWTNLASLSGGAFGDRTDNHIVSGVYRYVRMNGTSRSAGNNWGYSIFEIEIYGSPAAPAADSDNDGVNDIIDQCPGTPAGDAVDALGCTIVVVPVDTDNDGVVDSIDQCPNTPAGDNVDAVGCTIIVPADTDNDGVVDTIDQCPNTPAGDNVDAVGCTIVVVPADTDNDGIADTIDQCPGTPAGTNVDAVGCPIDLGEIAPLYSPLTALEPINNYVRADGVVVTRFGDRGRDRHAKDIGYYDPNNIFNSDHYDHWLAHYWEYRTARVQFEDHVANGQSLIRVTYITESQLSAKEFRIWFSGVTTTGQFHYNPTATYVGSGTWNDDFVKTSNSGHQFMYTIDITEQWKNVAIYNIPLQVGVNMEFEISQFLAAPPAGARKNYYGTSYVYVIGTAGMAPFEWDRNARDQFGTNDGSPIAAKGLLGGAGTLGYNYSEEPAGRFMEMPTNLSPGNAQPFVEGRRVHHTNFEDGSHDERLDNPVWTEQIGKLGNHYINESCANCHVRNGRALVAEPGNDLNKWVFKVGDAAGNSDPLIGRVLQPEIAGSGSSEGLVTLSAWTELGNGLRHPNYVFSGVPPATFSARIAPQLVGLGLLDAVSEDTVMEWADPSDVDGNPGISGRASLVNDPVTGETRLGRFGYKAAAFSVKHQVASALNTDMGVMTSVLPNPDCGNAQTDCDVSGPELSDLHLETLTKYIALLGVPARRDLNDSVALQGEAVFSDIGCDGCHRPSMQTSAYTPLTELRDQTIYPYTDMLLHDMGPGLADNLGEGLASGAEWRTTPLWGLGHAIDVMVRDAKANDTISMAGSADDINRVGFLHDGRARNIDEAIRWHGGEAQAAQSAYENLLAADKQALIVFLESL